jgi:hypothetical protein
MSNSTCKIRIFLEDSIELLPFGLWHCSVVEGYQYFGGPCFFHNQSSPISWNFICPDDGGIMILQKCPYTCTMLHIITSQPTVFFFHITCFRLLYFMMYPLGFGMNGTVSVSTCSIADKELSIVMSTVIKICRAECFNFHLFILTSSSLHFVMDRVPWLLPWLRFFHAFFSVVRQMPG